METFNLGKNEYTIKTIKELYSGEFGETWQLLQFLYFSFVTSDINGLYDSILEIKKDDENHSKLLAKILIDFGEEPSYISSKNIPLSGINFEYFKGIKNILNYALEIKEKSIINYKIAINKINEKNIKNLLENILVCEQKHKQIIEDLIKKYAKF